MHTSDRWKQGDTVVSPYSVDNEVTETEIKDGKPWVRMVSANGCEKTGDQLSYEEIGFVRKSDEAIKSNEC